MQAGKLVMTALLAMGDSASIKGPDVDTGATLLPPPSPAFIRLLKVDEDPNWALLQLP